MINIFKEIHKHNLQITIDRKSANNDVYYDYIEITISKPEDDSMSIKTMIKGTIAFYCYSNDNLILVIQDLISKLLKEDITTVDSDEWLDKKRTDLVNKYIEKALDIQHKEEGD